MTKAASPQARAICPRRSLVHTGTSRQTPVSKKHWRNDSPGGNNNARHRDMNNNVAQRIFFGLLLVVVTAAFLWLIRHFLQPIFWAVALAIVFYPLHRRLNLMMGNRPRIAAATSVIAILLIVVLPLAAVITAM